MACPIRARRSSVEHTLETIGQWDHDRDGFRPLRTASRACPPPRRGTSVRPAPAAHTSAPCRPDTRAPPWVQQAVVCCTRGGSRRVASAGAGAGHMANGGLLHCGQLCQGMWMAKPLKIFSTHRPWTASAQVAGQRAVIVKRCPHLYPQLAHSVIGVSAQNFHRVVHTAIGRPGRVGTRLS
jgi:hypothetical protein